MSAPAVSEAVRHAALAMAIIDLSSFKRDQSSLKVALGKHNDRHHFLQANKDEVYFSDAIESTSIEHETARSQNHLANLQKVFDYTSDRCLKSRFLIIDHCKHLENPPIRVTDALGLEDSTIEKAYNMKLQARLDGVLSEAVALNAFLRGDNSGFNTCFYTRSSSLIIDW